jgi:hypothetical protein
MRVESQPGGARGVLDGYKSKVQELQDKIASLQTRKRWALVVSLKLVVIGGGLLIATLHGTGLLAIALGMSVIGWIVAMRSYLRARNKAIQLARRSSFYERGVERLEDRWRGKGSTGSEFARTDHLYQSDLDILGEGSLFELLATTRSEVGAERLAAFLLDSPRVEEARERQEAVQELRGANHLREEVALLGKYSFQNCEGKHLREWLSLPALTVPHAVPAFLLFSGAVNLALGLSGCARMLHWTQTLLLMTPWLAAQTGISLKLMREVRIHLKALLTLGRDMVVLRQGVGLMQRQQFHCVKLRGLVERLCECKGEATIRKLERLLVAVERREDFILYGFSLWFAAGTQLVLATERWRAKHKEDFEDWIDAWAEFEALNAIACYAYEHPTDKFPELLVGEGRFEGKDLRHPLLPRERSIGNDLALNGERSFYVISGSNMAGKSTFLRTIGLNAVLAAAGAPVCARDARLTIFNLCASISIADSLAEGKSKFLAEVERLRASIRATEASKPVLFLIDEILSGTNSRDRRVAAEAVIAALVAGAAVGALSTHDLALTEIAGNPILCGCNVHMQSEDPEQPLAFDYRIKPGILQQTNALAIVKMLGIRLECEHDSLRQSKD